MWLLSLFLTDSQIEIRKKGFYFIFIYSFSNVLPLCRSISKFLIFLSEDLLLRFLSRQVYWWKFPSIFGCRTQNSTLGFFCLKLKNIFIQSDSPPFKLVCLCIYVYVINDMVGIKFAHKLFVFYLAVCSWPHPPQHYFYLYCFVFC